MFLTHFLPRNKIVIQTIVYVEANWPFMIDGSFKSVLKASTVECWLIPLIHPWSTLDGPLHQYLDNTQLTSWLTVSWDSFLQTHHSVLIDWATDWEIDWLIDGLSHWLMHMSQLTTNYWPTINQGSIEMLTEYQSKSQPSIDRDVDQRYGSTLHLIFRLENSIDAFSTLDINSLH